MKDPNTIVQVTCPSCGQHRNVTRIRAREIGYEKATCRSCANRRRPPAGLGHYKQPDPLARSLFRTRFYGIWVNMKSRCTNPNVPCWDRYGGRGITVCDRWQEFANFVADMHSTYNDSLTLERIDNAKGYSPENCRWASLVEQGANKRNNVLLTYNGVTHNRAEWSRRTGLSQHVIRARLKAGWSMERTLTDPLRVTRRSGPRAAR